MGDDAYHEARYMHDGNAVREPGGEILAIAFTKEGAEDVAQRLNAPKADADVAKLTADLEQQTKLVAYYKPKYIKLRDVAKEVDSLKATVKVRDAVIRSMKKRTEAFAEAFRSLVPEKNRCHCARSEDYDE